MLQVDEVAAQPHDLPGVAQDGLDVADLLRVAGRPERVTQQFGEPDDRRQRVPQLVGDRRHRRRLVGVDLRQLVEQGATFGHVPGVHDQTTDVRILEQVVEQRLDMPPAAIGRPDTNLDPLARLAAAAGDAGEDVLDHRHVVGVHVRQDAVGRVVRHPVADQPEDAGARPAPRAVRVEDRHEVLGPVEQPLDHVRSGQAAVPLRPAGAADDDHVARQRSGRVLDGRRLGQTVVDGTVSRDRPERTEVTAPCRPRLPPGRHRGPVVEVEPVVPAPARLFGLSR